MDSNRKLSKKRTKLQLKKNVGAQYLGRETKKQKSEKIQKIEEISIKLNS
jgi:hypothetical protein